MIECYIDGNRCYPSVNNKIKVTDENQFINDSGSYTYQISFPMSILENRKMFKNVSRMEVSKKLPTYENCKIIVDNEVIISGKGTIISITNEVVKLQIIGGRSRIKFNSKFEQHYIDEIEFPPTGIDIDTPVIGSNYKLYGWMKIDMSNTEIVGKRGEYVLNQVYDETNDVIANRIIVIKDGEDTKPYMYGIAVQPYLLYVLNKVIEYEGFTISRNDLDKEPWNRLVICNARKTTKINEALPHWSVYKFLEEMRKLFNASFVFNEQTKTVDIISTNELIDNERVNYECIDDYSVEHNEEGIKNVATSNIEYDWEDMESREIKDFIPQKILAQFPPQLYESEIAIIQATQSWPKKDKMTTLFKIAGEQSYYIYVKANDNICVLTQIGYFNGLYRDESKETEKLKITPVAMIERRRWKEDESSLFRLLDSQSNYLIFIPAMKNERESDVESVSVDDEGEYYISVEDALSDTDLIDKDNSDSDERIQIMFQANSAFNYANSTAEHPAIDGRTELSDYRNPTVFTDYRRNVEIVDNKERASLSLNLMPQDYGNIDYLNKHATNININTNDVYCIKFLCVGRPDPTKLYIFNSKLFICQKIESEIGDEGINRIKTGYFYEVIGDHGNASSPH